MSKQKKLTLGDFIENPDNPQKVTDEDFKELVKSIEDQPETLAANRIAFVTDYVSPISGEDMTGKRVVIAGNKRLRALKQIHGLAKEINPDWFFDMTPLGLEARRKWILRSNRLNGEHDFEKLIKLYSKEEIGEYLGEQVLEELIEAVGEAESGGKTDPDAAPEVADTPPVSRKGGVYRLGAHRVMCGDSTSPDDVSRLMGGKLADLIVTDPPYNVNYGGDLSEFQKKYFPPRQRTILNDHFNSDEEFGEKLLIPAFTNLFNNAAEHCVYYMTMPQGGTHMMMMMMMMMKVGWLVKHELIWVKNAPVLGRQDYNYQHEPISYGWKEKHRFIAKGEQHTSSVWNYPRPTKSELHPTMKPVALWQNMILNSSEEGEIVLDLFGGSGTTAIASEITKRAARLMELDPKYVDVIRKRWAEYVHGEGCDWQALTPEIEGAGNDKQSK